MKNKNSRLLTNVILIVVIAVLSTVMIITAFGTAKDNSIQQMDTMADERAIMIENYVDEAERTLSIYSQASEIINVCEHPEDAETVAAAQAFTERFSSGVENIEGIYVSMWTTQVLAHTNAGVVGMITRKDAEPLQQLHDALLAAGDGVYNTGIILSPAAAAETPNSEKQIVSMYKAVYNKFNEPIGLVGLGIYTKGLVKSMDNLSNKGLEKASYSMINVADNKYVFVPDETKIASEATASEILNTSKKLRGSKQNKTGTFEIEKNGKKYISTYSYNKDNGWLLMIDNPRNEVYAFANKITLYLALFCAVCLIIILLFNIISKKQEETNRKLAYSLEKNKKTKDNLNTAVMRDLLTDTFTRISFLTDYEPRKAADIPDKSYFFIMTTISRFSDINITSGIDAGDLVLVNVADALKAQFKGSKTYRTGSDEFVTVVSLPTVNGYNMAMADANKVISKINKPIIVEGKTINVDCAIAIAKKSQDASNNVLVTLKSMLNNRNMPITYTDLD